MPNKQIESHLHFLHAIEDNLVDKSLLKVSYRVGKSICFFICQVKTVTYHVNETLSEFVLAHCDDTIVLYFDGKKRHWKIAGFPFQVVAVELLLSSIFLEHYFRSLTVVDQFIGGFGVKQTYELIITSCPDVRTDWRRWVHSGIEINVTRQGLQLCKHI